MRVDEIQEAADKANATLMLSKSSKVCKEEFHEFVK
jgi:hypothetical protein